MGVTIDDARAIAATRPRGSVHPPRAAVAAMWRDP